MYKPGKQGKKLNVLTQQSQDILKEVKDTKQQYQFQILFQSNQLNDKVKKIMLYATSASIDNEGNINVENKSIVNAKDYLDDLIGNSQNNLSKDIDHNNKIKNVNLTFLDTETQDFKSLDVMDADFSEKQIACMYKKNELV